MGNGFRWNHSRLMHRCADRSVAGVRGQSPFGDRLDPASMQQAGQGSDADAAAQGVGCDDATIRAASGGTQQQGVGRF